VARLFFLAMMRMRERDTTLEQTEEGNLEYEEGGAGYTGGAAGYSTVNSQISSRFPCLTNCLIEAPLTARLIGGFELL
jgi:hypothetical protein